MELVIKTVANYCCKHFFTNNKITAIIINEYSNLYKLNIIFTERINRINETLIKWISQNYTIHISIYYMLFFLHNNKR